MSNGNQQGVLNGAPVIWAMGPVVTVNSSTLVNKGLELIEAHLLFDVAPADIAIVVHP